MLKETSADSAPSERRGFLLSEIPPHQRTCRKCGFEGEETLFKFSGKKGSRGNICRKCDAERSRKRQAEHGAEINARRRERRARDPERIRVRERTSRMKRIDRVRIQNAEAVKRYRERHPEKIMAQKIAQRALRRGEIKRPTCCEVLGCQCSDLEMHHVDYRKPKDVIFLCNARGANHHEAVHHVKSLRLKPGAIRKIARAPRAIRTAA